MNLGVFAFDRGKKSVSRINLNNTLVFTRKILAQHFHECYDRREIKEWRRFESEEPVQHLGLQLRNSIRRHVAVRRRKSTNRF